jgi:hypothetical protein
VDVFKSKHRSSPFVTSDQEAAWACGWASVPTRPYRSRDRRRSSRQA